MNKADNVRLNKHCTQAIQPSQGQSSVVHAIIWEAPYEGQRTLGIYTSRAAAEAALEEYLTAEDDDNDVTIKELALNQPADWSYSE